MPSLHLWLHGKCRMPPLELCKNSSVGFVLMLCPPCIRQHSPIPPCLITSPSFSLWAGTSDWDRFSESHPWSGGLKSRSWMFDYEKCSPAPRIIVYRTVILLMWSIAWCSHEGIALVCNYPSRSYIVKARVALSYNNATPNGVVRQTIKFYVALVTNLALGIRTWNHPSSP